MRLQRGRRPPACTGFGGSGGDRRGWCSSVCGPPSSASAVVLGPGLLCPVDVSRVSAQCQLGEPTQVWTLEKGKRRWALGGPASSRTRGLGPGHRARDTALDKRVPGSGSTAARVGFPGVVVSGLGIPGLGLSGRGLGGGVLGGTYLPAGPGDPGAQQQPQAGPVVLPRGLDGDEDVFGP